MPTWDKRVRPGDRKDPKTQTEQEEIDSEVQQTQVDAETTKSADDGSGGKPLTDR